MSGIGSSGFGPGVNPYAGNVNSTKGTDAARGDAAARSTAAEQSSFSQNLQGAGEAAQSDDRDADAFFTASGNNGNQQEESEQHPDADGSTTSNGPATSPEAIDQPLDDHRGNMINFDV